MEGYMRKATFLIIITAFVLFAANKALACSCSFSHPSQGFDRAQAVFTGKVIKAKKSEWIIFVDKVWKGEVEETITLRDAHAGTSCASGYKKGESYLFLVDVVKSESKTIYNPQVCNWGTRLNAARLEIGANTYAWVEDLVLKDRGEGKPPTKKER
jgi:hypothetical protein